MKIYVVITKLYDEIDFIKSFRDKSKANDLVKQMTEEAINNDYQHYGVYSVEVELDDEELK